VYSRFTDLAAKSSETTQVKLDGTVGLHDGWYSLEVRNQPTLNPDRVHVSVDVPEGWKIDKASGLRITSARHATTRMTLEKPESLRVHLVRSDANLWQRLQAGS
jgi:hypothetical protein